MFGVILVFVVLTPVAAVLMLLTGQYALALALTGVYCLALRIARTVLTLVVTAVAILAETALNR